MRAPRRGEVYFLDFSPAKGSEMRGPHPALIIQNDVGNRASRLTIVAAITSNLRAARLPVCVQVSPADSGLSRESVVNLGHIYTVDKSRLRQLVGRLPDSLMEQMDKALMISVGIRPFEL
jgi:mRNA interferase MazF